MLENWDRAISHILTWEGGSAVRDEEPHRPGQIGAVNRGVSMLAFSEWRESHGKPTPSLQDLLNMTEDEAKQIYWDKYANPIEFDHAPPGLDVVALHAAVMFGVRGCVKLVNAANNDWAKMIVLMMQNKMHREQSAWRFMRGWSDRFVAIYDLAKELSSAPVR